MVVGIRRMAWHHEDPSFYSWPSLIEGVKALPKYGYTFELCANVTQLDAAVTLVRATPDVTHAINHCGGPDIAADGFAPWADYMNQLAGFPNTVCKISGLVTRAKVNWTADDLRPYIDHLIDIFGFDRVMYGSGLAGLYARGDLPGVVRDARRCGGWRLRRGPTQVVSRQCQGLLPTGMNDAGKGRSFKTCLW